MMNFLIWLQDSALGTWVAGSIWGYPIILACHAVGMAAVVGTVVMINLRILGFARSVPVTLFSRLAVIAWAGLALNVLTGLALFTGDPVKFFYHPVFWIKISLIILGAVSVLAIAQELHKAASVPADSPEITSGAKLIAGFSLAFWAGAISAGRLIAYFEFGNGV